MFEAHITTREHGDIPGAAAGDYMNVQGLHSTGPKLTWLWYSGELTTMLTELEKVCLVPQPGSIALVGGHVGELTPSV